MLLDGDGSSVQWNVTNKIHGTDIFTHIYHQKSTINVGKDTNPMDPYGSYGNFYVMSGFLFAGFAVCQNLCHIHIYHISGCATQLLALAGGISNSDIWGGGFKLWVLCSPWKSKSLTKNGLVGGGFKYFLFSPRSFGKMNPFWLVFFGWVGSTSN